MGGAGAGGVSASAGEDAGGSAGDGAIAGGGTAGEAAGAAGSGQACGGVFDGSLILESQADADALRGVTTITGSLTIQGDVRNVDALGCLTEVGGGLAISNASELVNVDGLSGLRSAESVGVLDCPLLKNLDGLVGITSVTDIAVSGNASLADISGFRGLKSAGYVTIDSNPALVHLGGFDELVSVDDDIWIYSNAALSDISGFGKLRQVNRLTLRAGEGLTSLPLGQLRTANLLHLEDLPSLTSMQGFKRLTTLNSLEVVNTGLSDFSGLAALTSLRYLSASNDPALTTLKGLEQLTFFQDLALAHLPALVTLDGLGVGGRGFVDIEDAPQLIDISALAAPWDIDYLRLVDVDALQGLHGFEDVTSAIYLTLISDDALIDLSALSGLTDLDGLEIRDNATLSSLVGLENISGIYESFVVVDNPKLPTCEVERVEDAIGTVSIGYIEVSGNDDAAVCAR